ncbi:MAG: hypothetical protein ACREP1_13615, partial [Rhodanobacteraceae bacterium]
TVLFAAGGASASASVDAGLLALAPPGSKVVAAVDASRARGSQFGQFLINRALASDSNFERFLAETGFDPRRDLQDFVFAATGDPNSAGVILARGNFDPARIGAAAKARGASVQTYRGVDLILNSARAHESAAAFLAPDIAVMADVATVEEVIRRRSVPAKLDPALQRLIAGVGGNGAWFVSVSAGTLAAPEVARWNRTAASAVQSIVEASGGIRFTDPLAVTLHAVTGSPQEAEALSVVVRGLAAFARMGHPTEPYLAVLASARDMNIGADGSTVDLSFSIPEKEAEHLARYFPQTGSAARPR